VSDYSYDVLIVGGAIMGSSVAMALAERSPSLSVAVVDPDLEGGLSSTLKNAGGVRAMWRNRSNVSLCSFSIDYYRSVADEVQYRELGYFWLHGERTLREVEAGMGLYAEYGLGVEIHPPGDVARILPFVDSLDGVVGMSVTRKAGLIDHYSLREHYRRRAREAGVRFFDRTVARAVEMLGGRVRAVSAVVLEGENAGREAGRYLLDGTLPDSARKVCFGCRVLVNATGAWSPRVSALYGFDDRHVKPRRRQMVVLDCPALDLSRWGMIIDTSDVYFHQDGPYIVAGYSNMDEPYGYNMDYTFGGAEPESPFVRYIWAPLWKRISRFESVKVVRGWAGLYGETPDRSGYLGWVPGTKNVYESVAHTGRGVMISYAAGQALADLIVDGSLRPELGWAAALARSRPSGPQIEELHL